MAKKDQSRNRRRTHEAGKKYTYIYNGTVIDNRVMIFSNYYKRTESSPDYQNQPSGSQMADYMPEELKAMASKPEEKAISKPEPKQDSSNMLFKTIVGIAGAIGFGLLIHMKVKKGFRR